MKKTFTHLLFMTIVICGAAFMHPMKAQTSSTCLAPDTLAHDSLTSTTIVLNWTSVPDAQSYNVAYKPYGSSTTWMHKTVNGNHAQLTGLHPSTRYWWMVRANCSDTTGVNSPTGYFTTLPECVPPKGLTKEDVTLNSVKISWHAVIGAKGYWVAYKRANNVNAEWKYKGVSGTSTYLTDLRPSTKYVWMVGTRCFDMATDYSAQAYFTTAGECSAPRDRLHSNITSTSVVIRWDSVGDGDSYYVAYKSTTAPTWTYKHVAGTRTTLWNLTPSTDYVWIVASYCGDTASVYSPSANFTTLPPCTAPASLSKTEVTLNAVTLNWSSAIGAKSYQLIYRPNSAGTVWTTVPVAGTSMRVTGLTPKTQYVWKVSTKCGDGTSAYSANAYFTTPDSCSAPRNLTSGNITSSSAVVRWDPVGDGDSYNVAYKPSATTGGWKYKQVTGTQTTLNGLQPTTEYVWIVLTYCDEKVSEYSGNAYFTTKSAAGRMASVYGGEQAVLNPLSLESYPNPSKHGDALFVTFSLPEASNVQLSLIDANGSAVLTEAPRALEAGRHELLVDQPHLGGGFYILQLHVGNSFVRQKHLVMQD